MASQGPALISGEAQGVIDYVIKRAKQLQSRKFEIPIADLKPLLIGAVDEGHYLNRIRLKMRNQFRDVKIRQKRKGDAYEFELDPSIDINLATIRPIMDRQRVDTFTKFKEPFIAPQWFSDLVDALNFGCKPIIVGPQGCGKSRIAEEAMAELGRKMYRIALGEYRDPVDLIGTKEIVNEDGVPVTKLVGGILIDAMKNGWGIILDEYDMMAPQMLSALNRIMESGAQMLLPTEDGIVEFEPHPDTLIMATSNTWGFGDETNEFAGAQMQNRASWDRLHPKMDHDYDYDIERRLVSRHLPPRVTEALYDDNPSPNKLGLVRIIRKAIQDPANPLEDTLGLRTILFFAQSWKYYGWHKGMYYLINEFREENRPAVTKIVTNRFGQKFAPSRNDYNKNAPCYIPDMASALNDAGFLN